MISDTQDYYKQHNYTEYTVSRKLRSGTLRLVVSQTISPVQDK